VSVGVWRLGHGDCQREESISTFWELGEKVGAKFQRRRPSFVELAGPRNCLCPEDVRVSVAIPSTKGLLSISSVSTFELGGESSSKGE